MKEKPTVTPETASAAVSAAVSTPVVVAVQIDIASDTTNRYIGLQQNGRHPQWPGHSSLDGRIAPPGRAGTGADNAEADLLGGFGQAVVKADERPPARAFPAPDERRGELQRIGGTDSMRVG